MTPASSPRGTQLNNGTGNHLRDAPFADERGHNYFLSFSKPRFVYIKERRVEKVYWLARLSFMSLALAWCINEYTFLSIPSLIVSVVLFAMAVPGTEHRLNNARIDNTDIADRGSEGDIIYGPTDSHRSDSVDHRYLPVSKQILPFHGVVHQIGRQTLLSEFKVLTSSRTWQSELRSGLLQSFSVDKAPLEGGLSQSLLTRDDMERVGKRCRGIIRRIIRQAPCNDRLRKQYLKDVETSKYFSWLLNQGALEHFIELLPYSLENPESSFAGLGAVSLDPLLVDPTKFRIWTLKIFACHIVKRYLIGLDKYPPYDSKCVVCKEKRISVGFIGCNHSIVCGDCGREIFYSSEDWRRQCPMCRQEINGLTDETLERI